MSVVALALIALFEQQERRGREWMRQETARQTAALRPAPRQPNCPDLPNLKHLQLDNGRLAQVRIFQFDQTVYYIPSEWLRLETPTHDTIGGIDRNDLGLFNPDLQANECPGIVHQVTDGGLYMERHVGVGFQPRISQKRNVTEDVAYLFVHKLRRTRERADTSYQHNGLLSSMDHRTLDAYVRVASDVGVRLEWHPAQMTRERWAAQFQDWSSGPLVRVWPKPWKAALEAKDFDDLTSSARKLHVWLSSPPNRRQFKPPIAGLIRRS